MPGATCVEPGIFNYRTMEIIVIKHMEIFYFIVYNKIYIYIIRNKIQMKREMML